MKVRKQNSDDFIYYLVCLCTFGTAWIIRTIITIAIKQAMEKE